MDFDFEQHPRLDYPYNVVELTYYDGPVDGVCQLTEGTQQLMYYFVMVAEASDVAAEGYYRRFVVVELAPEDLSALVRGDQQDGPNFYEAGNFLRIVGWFEV
jgi:hypothetical protein